MRLCSFDVFDTVLTRTVAEPVDLFQICGQCLRDSGLIAIDGQAFAQARIEAEARARASAPGAEPTLAEIYRELARPFSWNEGQSIAATAVELASEAASLRAMPGAHARVGAARTACEQFIYLSDMYLPAKFIEGILRRENLFETTDRLYVSNAHRASKASGELFDIVRREFGLGADWRHVGDKKHSDYTMPRRHHIAAELDDAGELNRREKLVRGTARIAPLGRSRLSAAMRLARLRQTAENAPPSPVSQVGKTLAGPVLFAYVAWVLGQAADQDIRRLYFIARDGEILLKVARILCEIWNLPIDCRYLYGSRQAWHGASVEKLGPTEKKWLFEADIPLTILVLATRLGIAPLAISQEIAKRGGRDLATDIALDPQTLDRIWDALREPPLSVSIAESAASSRATVMGYLKQEGFFESSPAAIVDIGWRGNMQRSLARLLESAKRPHPLTGFYFGFVAGHSCGENFRSFWQASMGTVFPMQRVTLMEIFTAGKEGSAFAFARREARFEPVLNRPVNDQAVRWGVSFLQDAIAEFAAAAAREIPFAEARTHDVGAAAGALFQDLCENPTSVEAHCLGSFLHATDQMETVFRPMLYPMLSWWSFSRLAWRRDLWNAFPWIEGQMAMQSCWPVSLAKNLRRVKGRITRRTNESPSV